MYKNKEDILRDFPELEITDFGDFKVKDELIKDYDIIDFHCHLYEGVKSLIPKIMRRSSNDLDTSFFDGSCFPISIKYFNFNKVLYTTFPERFLNLKLIYTGLKLLSITGKSTPIRMIRDMKLNNISKAVVLQARKPNCDSSEDMKKKLISQYNELITFGCVHPHDNEIEKQIEKKFILWRKRVENCSP